MSSPGPSGAMPRRWPGSTTSTPDLAILDYKLNDGFCIDLARTLRARGVPFVVYSGDRQAPGMPPEFEGAPWIEKPCPAPCLPGCPQRLSRARPGFVGPGRTPIQGRAEDPARNPGRCRTHARRETAASRASDHPSPACCWRRQRQRVHFSARANRSDPGEQMLRDAARPRHGRERVPAVDLAAELVRFDLVLLFAPHLCCLRASER